MAKNRVYQVTLAVESTVESLVVAGTRKEAIYLASAAARGFTPPGGTVVSFVPSVQCVRPSKIKCIANYGRKKK